MRVDIHTFPFGSSTPVYGGYIEMEEFNADKCWELCNWTAWADENQIFYIQKLVLALMQYVLPTQKQKKSG